MMAYGQLTILAGGVVGLGLALIIWTLAPARTSLKDFVAHIQTADAVSRRPARQQAPTEDLQGRLGLWLERRVPATRLIHVPTSDLELLGYPRYRFVGEKAAFGVIGLLLPTVLGVVLPMVGVQLPFVVPLAGSLLCGFAATFLADYNARDDAAKARLTFKHALSAYIDLVAVALSTGSMTHQAAMEAAQVSNAWPFRMIAQELSEATLSGKDPWDNLDELGNRLNIPDLGDLADTMRLSAQDSAAVYTTLIARSANLRDQLQTAALEAANVATERMTAPSAALLISLFALVAFPFLLPLIGG